MSIQPNESGHDPPLKVYTRTLAMGSVIAWSQVSTWFVRVFLTKEINLHLSLIWENSRGWNVPLWIKECLLHRTRCRLQYSGHSHTSEGVRLSAKRNPEILTVHQTQKDSEVEGQGMKTHGRSPSFPLKLQMWDARQNRISMRKNFVDIRSALWGSHWNLCQ